MEEMLLGRGPFSVADNRAALRALGAAVLVSKDSGEAGGLEAKAEAACLENAVLVEVERCSDALLFHPTLIADIRAAIVRAAGPNWRAAQ